MQTISIPPGRYTRQTFDTALLNGLDQSRTDGAVMGVSASGVVLDLSGVFLDGEGAGGIGISVRDCEDVTVQNGVIRGFHYGIHVENVNRLSINNCVVSDNANPIDAGLASRYGFPSRGGIRRWHLPAPGYAQRHRE